MATKRTATRDPDEGLTVHRTDGWVPPFAEPTGKEYFDWRQCLVTDTEANGLLDLQDWHFHCAWTFDPNTGIYRGYRPHQMERYADDLSKVTPIAHNGLGYDFQAMEKAFPGWTCKGPLVDTLVLVKMLWSIDELMDKDVILWRRGQMPGEQMKRQGIEAWGYRLGQMKGDYSKQRKEEYKAQGGDPKNYDAMMRFVWGDFNEPMFTYNKQDVVVNWELLKLVCRKLGWFQHAPLDKDNLPGNPIYQYPALPVETEHLMQAICLKQELHGLGFNRDKAVTLSADLLTQRDEIEGKVASIFKPWWQPKGDTERGTLITSTRHVKRPDLPDVTIPRYSKTGKPLKPYVGPPGAWYEEGCYHVPITYTTFNLRNRHHLAARLQAVYGWKPMAFGGAKGTDPVIDEATLSSIPDDVLPHDLKKIILDYYVIDKTYSTLTGGTKSWMTLLDEDTGTIHGRCDPLGTVTHRAAHSNPTLGNIPSVDLDEQKGPDGKVIHKEPLRGLAGAYGYECRELFGPLPIFGEQTGTDMYALELFMLAHFLWPYDGGAMIERLNSGVDIHQAHADMIGLPRKPTKTTTYATIYGSGGFGIGEQVWEPTDDIDEWAEAPGVKSWINFQKRQHGEGFKLPSKLAQAQYGKGQYTKNKLLNGIPGLSDLIKNAKGVAERNHRLRLLDGRYVFVRKEFASLNALLQANGAIACKLWIIAMHRLMAEAGLRESKLEIGTGRILEVNDWNQIAWVHDETQNEHRKGLGPTIAKISTKAAEIASQQLKLRITLTTDSKTGDNWAVCH